MARPQVHLGEGDRLIRSTKHDRSNGIGKMKMGRLNLAASIRLKRILGMPMVGQQLTTLVVEDPIRVARCLDNIRGRLIVLDVRDPVVEADRQPQAAPSMLSLESGRISRPPAPRDKRDAVYNRRGLIARRLDKAVSDTRKGLLETGEEGVGGLLRILAGQRGSTSRDP